MKLPDMVFDGATFQVTPRGFDGDGVLVKLEMIPKALEESQPRILFKKISKKLNKISKCTALFQNSWLVDLLYGIPAAIPSIAPPMHNGHFFFNFPTH